MRRWRWILALVVWGQWLWMLPSHASSIRPVDMVHRTILVDGAPPLDEQTVSVPDRLEVQWHAPHIRIRYELTVPEGPAGKGLWLARVGAPFRLWVDGRPLQPFLPATLPAPLTAADEHQIFNGRMPFLFALPDHARTVRIDFAGTAYMPTGLAAARWGLPSDLAIAHLERHEQMTRPTEVNTVLAAVLGSLAMVLWLFRRDVVLLPIFAAICATLTLRDWSYTAALLPLDTEKAYLFHSLLSVSLTVTVLASLLALSDRLVWRYTRWLIAGAIGLLLPLAVTQWLQQGMIPVRLGILFLGMLNIPFSVALLFRWRRQIGNQSAYVLMTGLLVLLVVSVHDLSWTLGFQPPLRVSYVPLAFACLLLCYAYITAEHVLRNLHLVENANALLQQQVEHTRVQLQTSHARLSRLQAQEARATERASLVETLHQGLGHRLSSLARNIDEVGVDAVHTREHLELGLQNLRQLLSVHQSDESVVMALATWRQSWQPRLEAAGTPMRWTVDDSADDATLPTHRLMVLVDSLSAVAESLWRSARQGEGHVHLRLGVGTHGRLQVQLTGTGVPEPEHSLRQQLQQRWSDGESGLSNTLSDPGADWQWCWETGGHSDPYGDGHA